MGRVVERNIANDILDKTMYVFWERGYFNTSIDDVVAATGFNKAAIYKYFGGKHALFVAMLKRYREVVTPRLTAPLQETHQGLKAIEHFFNQFLTLNKNDTPCGCFLIATASELPSHDEAVRYFIQQFTHDVKKWLLACLMQAQNNQHRAHNTNPKAIVDFLVVNIFGLMTLHRTDVTTQTIKHHITTIKQYLNTLTTKASQ